MNDFQTFWYVLATGLAGVLVVIKRIEVNGSGLCAEIERA